MASDPNCYPDPGVLPHIGAFRNAGEASASAGWKWINGEPWSFTDWAGLEPNNDPVEAAGGAFGFNNVVCVDVKLSEDRSLLVEFE